MRLETAGDPISGVKWTHKATEKIAKELRRLGIHVGKSTVGRLLKALTFSLRLNHKKRAHGSSPATRDLQFRYIRRLRTTFAMRDDPIISVDTKKRELVGNFKNDGKAWSQAPRLVNDHDFRSLAKGVAIPSSSTTRKPIVPSSASERPVEPPNLPLIPSSDGGDSRADGIIQTLTAS
jgi:Rhodopirellula transposase DDE domain